jgi:hypothetical protein
VTNCAKFHWVAPGVVCSQITSYQKISLDDFVKWNPTVGNDCTSMQANVNVCVGVIGGTTTKPTPTTTAGNGIQTPQPTQPGMVTNCKKFHYVAEKSRSRISFGGIRESTATVATCGQEVMSASACSVQ